MEPISIVHRHRLRSTSSLFSRALSSFLSLPFISVENGLVRLLQRKLQIGLAEQTLLASLGQAAVYAEKHSSPPRHIQSPLEEAAKIVKQVSSVLPVYDKIIRSLLSDGVWNLPKTCTFTVGVPVGPMLAKPTKGVSEIVDKFQNMEFTCEYKYDGERAQIHYMEDGSVKIYSRNVERNIGKFPDIVLAISRLKKSTVRSFVLDCEIVAFNRANQKILSFQILSKHARKIVSVSVEWNRGSAAQKQAVWPFVCCRNFWFGLVENGLVRLLQRKLQIGLAEQTLLASLGQAAVYTEKHSSPPRHIQSPLEEAAKIVKQVSSVLPVHDKIIRSLLSDGVWNLPRTCTFTVGVPVGPMLAKPTKGVSEIVDKFQNMEFTCEYKYDGERAQIHYMEDGSVKTYSRNVERNIGKFPDIVLAISRLKKSTVRSFVLDCEIVAFNRANQKILPFQILSKHARKNVSVSVEWNRGSAAQKQAVWPFVCCRNFWFGLGRKLLLIAIGGSITQRQRRQD
ncbi:DNA ligase, ATP-dependent, central [Dillenia turbinata]|uniref:DNA ligase, ATP-dependent, central n=1 Tax=Dillenia turbinata TaxID=194707 RepID=A0AAN8UZH3_9MAGN